MTDLAHINWLGLGAALRAARESRDITLEAAAHHLCLSKHQVVALEEDRSISFPSDSLRFTCARRYCAYMALDWTPFVEAPETQSVAPASPASSAPDTAPTDAFAVMPNSIAAAIVHSAPADGEISPEANHAPAPPAVVRFASNPVASATPMQPVEIETRLTARSPRRRVVPILFMFLLLGGVVVLFIRGAWHETRPGVVPTRTDTVQLEPVILSVPEQLASRDPSVAESAPTPTITTPNPVIEASPPEEAPRVVEIVGASADKQSSSFYVEGRTPFVILKKRAKGEKEPARIEFPRNTSTRVSVASDELVRLAEGQNVSIFYQGRPVPSSVLESGAWLRFIPKSKN
jgi:hypothetical protein